MTKPSPFDPADFLRLAQALSEAQSSAEAEFRSAASRTYYAVFLEARERLINRGQLAPNRTGAGHLAVGRALRFRNRLVGNEFDRLRRLRNRADYDVTHHIGRSVTARAVGVAQSIWSRL